MEISEVRTKAKELKTTIEQALRKFRDETGYTPVVTIDDKSRHTNDGTFVSQVVSVQVNLG